MIRRDTVLGVVVGVILGYIGWLAAISIADDFMTVSVWSVIVLILSVLLSGLAVAWGLRLRRRRNYAWAAFAFGLPVLPVVLTLGLLTDTYL